MRLLYHPLSVLILLMLPALACNLVDTDDEADLQLITEERPAVILLAPANNSVYAAGTSVILHAEARDLAEGVDRIEFTIDVPGEPVVLVVRSDEASERFQAIETWQAVGNQSYIIEVRAYRDPGTPDDPSDDVPGNVERVLIEVRPPVASPATIDALSTEAPAEMDTVPSGENGDGSDTDTLPETAVIGVVNTADTVVRQGPGTTFQSITTLSPGDEVGIVGRSTDDLWYVIAINNGAGWVFKSFITVVDDTSSLPVIETPPQE